jgi:uncharacterized cofD-like protein
MKRRVTHAATQSWHTHLKWLTPGLGVKRWLLFLILGVGLLSLGGALTLRALYPLPPFFYFLTLQFLPRALRAGLIVVIGLSAILYGLWGFNKAILAPFLKGSHAPIPEVLYDYRRRGRGPKIVVIGGGHGQATALRGLKAYTSNLTAIVTVADDGGSSGRLRRDIGILPPGDFRNCIAALANDESLVTRLFQYRFADGKDLGGHSFGNLFISAMAGITGSFELALKESSQVLAVQGQVLPSTLETVILCADIAGDDEIPVRVRGESHIPDVHGRILRVMLEPTGPSAYPGAIRAILNADLVVIGPGSLYTSILPNLMVPELVEALRATQAPKVYVCNVATEPGETDHYTAEAHVKALEQHIGPGVINTVFVNANVSATINAGRQKERRPEGVTWVKPDVTEREGLRVVQTDLIDVRSGLHHDSHKLADALLNIIK